MRYQFLACFCICALSCGQPGNDKNAIVHEDSSINRKESPGDSEQITNTQQITQDEYLIIPGDKLGNTTLGITTDSLEKLLGKPDKSDAAMGKAWLTWYGKRDEHNNSTRLDIYTTYKDSTMMEKTVQQVHTTSAYFHTAGNLHVYSSMQDIRKSFPKLKKTAHYKSEGRDIFIYDEQHQGIAFEAVTVNNQDLCIGIVIHKQHIPVTNTYIYLQPGTQLIR